ncbi:hypothetical protein ElyMa_005246500 [Elysia marginata]|uniref:Transmembrane protein n=1 Tax=Elysia marginata TaxID=1093978 RepID=A0AAV4JXQ5_9GAST|nr:hypothetical protein ElyMa_005246500 [Elysia marginata]
MKTSTFDRSKAPNGSYESSRRTLISLTIWHSSHTYNKPSWRRLLRIAMPGGLFLAAFVPQRVTGVGEVISPTPFHTGASSCESKNKSQPFNRSANHHVIGTKSVVFSLPILSPMNMANAPRRSAGSSSVVVIVVVVVVVVAVAAAAAAAVAVVVTVR